MNRISLSLVAVFSILSLTRGLCAPLESLPVTTSTAATSLLWIKLSPFGAGDDRKITVGDLSLGITPAFSQLTARPTTLSGYGITDGLGSSAVGVTIQGYSANTTLLGNLVTGTGSIARNISPIFQGTLTSSATTMSGQVLATAGTASTTTGTGSIVVTGGVGISGSLNASTIFASTGAIESTNSFFITRSTLGSATLVHNGGGSIRWTADGTVSFRNDGNTLRTDLNVEANGTLQHGTDHATTATDQTIKAHDVTTGTGAKMIVSGGKGSVSGGRVELATSVSTAAPSAALIVLEDGTLDFARSVVSGAISVVSTDKIAIKVNGVTYYLLVTTVP